MKKTRKKKKKKKKKEKKQRLDPKITAHDSEVDKHSCAECLVNCHTTIRRDKMFGFGVQSVQCFYVKSAHFMQKRKH
jgi:aldehyde:ferredoxin oxidoreductase